MTAPRPSLHLTSISAPASTPSAALTRALASTQFLAPDPALVAHTQNHMRAWAQRQRDSYAAAVADLRARGVTALMCPDCGCRHGLGMVGLTCNAHTDWGVCDSTARLIEVLPTLRLSSGLGGTAEVRYSTRGVRL